MLQKMQQYDLLDLRSFITVVEVGAFNRAADLLDTSTASVSRRVSNLEKALGVKLLNRTTRKLDLSDAGMQFYTDALAIFRALDEAEEKARSGREIVKGKIRVAAPLSFGMHSIAPFLPKFMHKYPELNVQLLLEDRQTDLVAEGIDVAIRIGSLKDSSLVATPISSIPRVFCASSEYLEHHGEPHEPAELVDHNCLHYSLISTREEWGFLKDEQEQSIEVSGTLSTNNGEVLKEAAIQGIGISLLPSFIVSEAIEDGRLVKVLADYEPEPFGLYAIRPSRQYTPVKVKLLIGALKSTFSVI